VAIGMAGVGAFLNPAEKHDRSHHPSNVVSVDDTFFIGTAPDRNNQAPALLFGKEVLSSPPHIINFFLESNFYKDPNEMIKRVNSNLDFGSVPMVSFGLGELLQGDRDVVTESTRLNILVDAFDRVRGPVFFRPFYEMNTNWAEAWYQSFTPDTFIATWRQMYDFVKEKLGQEVYFVFAPNATTIGHRFTDYYPGPEFVDALGLDAYSRHNSAIINPRRYAFPDYEVAEVLGPDVLQFLHMAPDKPLLITETNAIDNRVKWITDLIVQSRSWGAVGAVLFEWNKAELLGINIAEANWRLSREERNELRSNLSMNTVRALKSSGVARAREIIEVILSSPVGR